jgi:oligogalacturonide transporter
VIVSLRFKLDPRTHDILMAEIERFRTTPDQPPSDEARLVAEDLSGWPHEKLWGRNPVADSGMAQPAGFPVQVRREN